MIEVPTAATDPVASATTCLPPEHMTDNVMAMRTARPHRTGCETASEANEMKDRRRSPGPEAVMAATIVMADRRPACGDLNATTDHRQEHGNVTVATMDRHRECRTGGVIVMKAAPRRSPASGAVMVDRRQEHGAVMAATIVMVDRRPACGDLNATAATTDRRHQEHENTIVMMVPTRTDHPGVRRVSDLSIMLLAV